MKMPRSSSCRALVDGACQRTAASIAAPPPITLGELEQLALQNNPDGYARPQLASMPREAGRGRPAHGRTRSSAIRARKSRQAIVDLRGEHGFFVEQTIPLGGKLRLSRARISEDDRAS